MNLEITIDIYQILDVVHASWKLTLRKLRQVELVLVASLGYKSKLCFKTQRMRYDLFVFDVVITGSHSIAQTGLKLTAIYRP